MELCWSNQETSRLPRRRYTVEHWRIANACMSTTAITTLAFLERQGLALETWAALSHQQAYLSAASRQSSRKQVEMSYCK